MSSYLLRTKPQGERKAEGDEFRRILAQVTEAAP